MKAKKVTIKSNDKSALYNLSQLGENLVNLKCFVESYNFISGQEGLESYKKTFPNPETAETRWRAACSEMRQNCEAILECGVNFALHNLGMPTIEIDFENTLTSL